MKYDKDITRCKLCGKVIVGGGKMGLCDSCFSNDAGKVGIIASAAVVALWKPVKKYGPKLVKGIVKLIKR